MGGTPFPARAFLPPVTCPLAGPLAWWPGKVPLYLPCRHELQQAAPALEGLAWKVHLPWLAGFFLACFTAVLLQYVSGKLDIMGLDKVLPDKRSSDSFSRNC